MFLNSSKFTARKSIIAITSMTIMALIIVAGCISTERTTKKVERPSTAITLPKQLNLPETAKQRLKAQGIDPQQLQAIGQKIFQNETGGKLENVIFWSNNESFPSLGVGHFIWFPAGTSIGFTESFPSMIRYLKANGIKVPSWLLKQIQIGAIWNSREQLENARGTPKFLELQQLLIDTSGLQVLYLYERLDKALPNILRALGPAKRQRIVDRFYTVRASSGGLYPLVDYVNFKGEGTVTSEKHNGVGWGLLHVLELMEPTAVGNAALKEFAIAADLVLTRRVANAPPKRNEQRWLPGWRVRLKTYYR